MNAEAAGGQHEETVPGRPRTIFPETECHRLIREENWEALVNRLKTPEGINDAKTTLRMSDIPKSDPHWKESLPPVSCPSSIYHCQNVFRAPLFVIRAMTEAHPNGWTTPCVINSYPYNEEYPIFVAFKYFLGFKNENLFYILQNNPNVARKHAPDKHNYFPLHDACFRNCDEAVKLLLAAYPKAASVPANTNEGIPFLIGLANQLEPETLRILLAAYPAAAKVKTKDGNYALHYVCSSEWNHDTSFFESILYYDPLACSVKNQAGSLPIHEAMRAGGDRCSDEEKLDFHKRMIQHLLNECPESVETQDNDGILPLHILCIQGFESKMQLSTLEKLLEMYPAGAQVKDSDGLLPIQHLVEQGWEGCFKEEAFIKLAKITPQSLLVKQGGWNPFIVLCNEHGASDTLWKNAATYFPCTLCSVDDNGSSALSYEFSSSSACPLQMAQPSPRNRLILDTTFRCMRITFGVWSNTPVSDSMHWFNKIVFCGYLYSSPDEMPRPFDEMNTNHKNMTAHAMIRQDEYGANAFHIACSAPCPRKNRVCGHCDKSLLEALFSWTPADVIERVVTRENIRGEIPLHLLLKNANACRASFFYDVQLLSSLDNGESVFKLDPVAKLYPFMCAASFCEQKDKALSISTTYHLLQSFVSRHNLEFLPRKRPRICREGFFRP